MSNIVREIKSTTGTLTYQVGTRNAATTLRLKDGETQVLAGLISDEDRKTAWRLRTSFQPPRPARHTVRRPGSCNTNQTSPDTACRRALNADIK